MNDRPSEPGDHPRERPRGEGRGDRRGRDAGNARRTGRDGERRNSRSTDGDRPRFRRTDGERRTYRDRDGERRSGRDGERRNFRDKDGERRNFRDKDGERRNYRDRDGERRGGRDGERREYRDRDDRGRGRGDRPSYGRGGTRGGGRSDRGGRDREFTEAERLAHELRPVREAHEDPEIPHDVQPKDLHPAARNELKTLQPDVQERVARHLAMVAALIDTDPALAHQHALSASRRAGRIPVTRETLAVTAYRLGDYALALRELRTHRRLTGSQGHIALMVDSERGLGRPEKGIETGLQADRAALSQDERVYLAIAMSGARLDLGQTQQALFELELPELNPKKAYSWSPELFGAYATVLEDLGREDEAREWHARGDRAAAALQDHYGSQDTLDVIEILEHEGLDDEEANE